MNFRIADSLRPIARHRRIGVEALAVISGQALAGLGSIVGVRVLTGAMSPTAYGELALAVTLGALGLQVLLAPVATSAIRFFAPSREAGDLRGFLLAVRRLIAICAAIVAATALVAVGGVFVTSRTSLAGLVLVSFAFTLFSGVSSVLDGIQNAARHRVIAAAHSGLGPWIRFVMAVAVIRMTTMATSASAMSGYAIAAAIVCASQFLFVQREITPLAAATPVDERRWMKAMLAYGYPFAAWGIFAWAQIASDRWALGMLVSTKEVGYYAVIYQLGFFPILTASSVIGQVFSPVLYARAGDASDYSRVAAAIRLNWRLAMLMLALTAAGAGLVAWIHPWIGRLVLAPQYRGITHYLPWMVIAGGIYSTGQIMSIVFMISNRSAALTVPKITTAVIGVAANFAGAKLFGVSGVIGALVTFGVIYCAWVAAASTRLRRPADEALA